MTSKVSEIKINYQEYPEFMFAMIAAFLEEDEGDDLRRVSGKVYFRSEDEYGNTYRNGLLHSFGDEPAITDFFKKSWFKDGKLHREGDLPACISLFYDAWYKNGVRHRDGGLPAIIPRGRRIDDKEEFWVDGKFIK
jgi:hypothetical protein